MSTDTETYQHGSTLMGRRQMLQMTTGAVTAAAVGTASSGSVAALDNEDLPAPFGNAYRVSGWVGDSISDLFARDDDLDGFTGADALREAILERATQQKRDAEQTLSALENTAEFADNVAIPKGMAAVVEELNDGGDSSDANDAMEEAIDEDYYVPLQIDLIDHFRNRRDQWFHYLDQIDNHDDTEVIDHFWSQPGEDRSSYDEDSWDEIEFFTSIGDDDWDHGLTLLNGELEEFETFMVDPDASRGEWPILPLAGEYEDEEEHGRWYGHLRYEYDGQTVDFWDHRRFKDLWYAIEESRDRVYSELSDFVNDVYGQYDAGDIDLSEFVDPITAHTDLSDGDGGFADSAASILGIPRSESPQLIFLEESEVEVEGRLFATDSPEDGFDVGESYDPDDYDFPIFLGYNQSEIDDSEDSDFVQLEQPFEIREARDSDGEDVDNVELGEGPTYDPSDTDDLQEQLDQIREEQVRLQEEAQADDGFFGGGGGINFGGADIPLVGVVIGVVLLGWAFLGGDD